MEKWIGRTALVTGASVGIGAAIFKALVTAGMTVIGAARGVDKMQALAESLREEKGSFKTIKCDLTVDKDIYNLFKEIKSKYGGVDICVNNAGLSYDNALLNGTPDQWRHMANVNIIALCLCSQLAINSMRERGVDDGHIININSLVGHQVLNVPEVHFYTGTKHAVTAITEGLRQEMRQLKSRIRITSISPGGVESEFANRMYGEERIKKLSRAFPIKILKSEDIAATLLHVISAPSHVEINEVIIRSTEQPF